ncbi:MAG: nifE: nitrogenase MoFe cofactor biosynthesis protein NifE [Paenibacillaceae bacterium]|nr:nifE: nitrogenase MoFe cofactor biosynthesis protein NifE [Paenibacillaceae bacterium]
MSPTIIQDSAVSGLQHLRRLSAVKSERAIEMLTPAANPGSHCPMHTTLSLAGRMAGVSTLVIGMPECGTYSKMVIPEPYGKLGELHWVYLLDGNEVVFGCSKGLSEAIKEMDAAGARAILLIVTCIPNLIAEDVEMLVQELEPQLSTARLAVVQAAHFTCSSYPPGYWRTLAAMGSLMEEGPDTGTARTINVMSFGAPRNAVGTELEQLLGGQGWHIRHLGPGSALDDYLEAPKASLNIVASPHYAELAAVMEKQLGIPAVQLHSAYSGADIGKAYERIAELLDIPQEEALHPAHEELLRLEREAENQMKGITFAITDGRVDPLPLAAYWVQLGMEPLLIHMEGFGQGDKAWGRTIVKSGYDPLICHMANPEADAAVIAELSPGICVGRPLAPRAQGTAYLEGLSASAATCGYARSIGILESLFKAIQQEE